jgi:hypothetical protein
MNISIAVPSGYLNLITGANLLLTINNILEKE